MKIPITINKNNSENMLEKLYNAYTKKSEQFRWFFFITNGLGVIFLVGVIFPYYYVHEGRKSKTIEIEDHKKSLASKDEKTKEIKEIQEYLSSLQGNVARKEAPRLKEFVVKSQNFYSESATHNWERPDQDQQMAQQSSAPPQGLGPVDLYSVCVESRATINKWMDCVVENHLNQQYLDFASEFKRNVTSIDDNKYNHVFSSMNTKFASAIKKLYKNSPSFWKRYDHKEAFYRILSSLVGAFSSEIKQINDELDLEVENLQAEIDKLKEEKKANVDWINQTQKMDIPMGEIPIRLSVVIIFFRWVMLMGFMVYCFLYWELSRTRKVYDQLSQAKVDPTKPFNININSVMCPTWFDDLNPHQVSIFRNMIFNTPLVLSLISAGLTLMFDDSLGEFSDIRSITYILCFAVSLLLYFFFIRANKQVNDHEYKSDYVPATSNDQAA